MLKPIRATFTVILILQTLIAPSVSHAAFSVSDFDIIRTAEDGCPVTVSGYGVKSMADARQYAELKKKKLLALAKIIGTKSSPYYRVDQRKHSFVAMVNQYIYRQNKELVVKFLSPLFMEVHLAYYVLQNNLKMINQVDQWIAALTKDPTAVDVSTIKNAMLATNNEFKVNFTFKDKTALYMAQTFLSYLIADSREALFSLNSNYPIFEATESELQKLAAGQRSDTPWAYNFAAPNEYTAPDNAAFQRTDADATNTSTDTTTTPPLVIVTKGGVRSTVDTSTLVTPVTPVVPIDPNAPVGPVVPIPTPIPTKPIKPGVHPAAHPPLININLVKNVPDLAAQNAVPPVFEQEGAVPGEAIVDTATLTATGTSTATTPPTPVVDATAASGTVNLIPDFSKIIPNYEKPKPQEMARRKKYAQESADNALKLLTSQNMLSHYFEMAGIQNATNVTTEMVFNLLKQYPELEIRDLTYTLRVERRSFFDRIFPRGLGKMVAKIPFLPQAWKDAVTSMDESLNSILDSGGYIADVKYIINSFLDPLEKGYAAYSMNADTGGAFGKAFFQIVSPALWSEMKSAAKAQYGLILYNELESWEKAAEGKKISGLSGRPIATMITLGVGATAATGLPWVWHHKEQIGHALTQFWHSLPFVGSSLAPLPASRSIADLSPLEQISRADMLTPLQEQQVDETFDLVDAMVRYSLDHRLVIDPRK